MDTNMVPATPGVDHSSPTQGRVAFVTGVTGQDGSYLVELLLSMGYEVHGIKRRASSYNHPRLEHILTGNKFPNADKFHLHYGDVLDFAGLVTLMSKIRPVEVYNLAAQSHVKVSFEMPQYTGDVDGLGVLNVLEAVRVAGLEKHSKVYQASTSELYGLVHEVPQSETTPFHPRSPYGVAKLYGFWIVKNYRESYDMFACNGILFNHESPRRGENFVTRKITMAVARIKLGMQDCLLLGNLGAQRDWGHARDYVRCMWLMLQRDTPDDYVVATGVTTTVRRFCELAFAAAGITVEFSGEGINEIGVVTSEGPLQGKTVVKVDERFFRPAEVELLLGDPKKAHDVLGWDPKGCTDVENLCKEMVEADIEMARDPTAYLKF
jgi:GDPmannose 4,6-dehydratase